MKKQETVFETVDRYGRSVRFRKVVYEKHLPERPEMADYIQEAACTVSDLDSEYREEDDADELSIRIYYRMGMGNDRYDKCLLKIPVYYDRANEGEVATFYFTRRVTGGTLIWRRGQN